MTSRMSLQVQPCARADVQQRLSARVLGISTRRTGGVSENHDANTNAEAGVDDKGAIQEEVLPDVVRRMARRCQPSAAEPAPRRPATSLKKTRIAVES